MHLIWFSRESDVHKNIWILSNVVEETAGMIFVMCFHQASIIRLQVTPSQSWVVCLSHEDKGVTETPKCLWGCQKPPTFPLCLAKASQTEKDRVIVLTQNDTCAYTHTHTYCMCTQPVSEASEPNRRERNPAQFFLLFSFTSNIKRSIYSNMCVIYIDSYIIYKKIQKK